MVYDMGLEKQIEGIPSRRKGLEKKNRGDLLSAGWEYIHWGMEGLLSGSYGTPEGGRKVVI
jgi:hypothetical protein